MNSTTVIVKIKGKPRSLFYNKRTVIGKLMHIITDIENKSVELICKNNDVLVYFISWIYFFDLVYCIEHNVFISLKCEARLFRVTPHQFNTGILDRKPIIEIWSQKTINKIVYKHDKHVCILFLTYTHRKLVTNRL